MRIPMFMIMLMYEDMIVFLCASVNEHVNLDVAVGLNEIVFVIV